MNFSAEKWLNRKSQAVRMWNPFKFPSFCTGLFKMHNFAYIPYANLVDQVVFRTFLDFTKKYELAGTFNPRTYKRTRTPTVVQGGRGLRGGEGMMGPSHWVFERNKFHWLDIPELALQDKTIFVGYDVYDVIWRSMTSFEPTSWIRHLGLFS